MSALRRTLAPMVVVAALVPVAIVALADGGSSPPDDDIEEFRVEGHRSVTATSSMTVPAANFELMPLESGGQMLEAVPNLAHRATHRRRQGRAVLHPRLRCGPWHRPRGVLRWRPDQSPQPRPRAGLSRSALRHEGDDRRAARPQGALLRPLRRLRHRGRGRVQTLRPLRRIDGEVRGRQLRHVSRGGDRGAPHGAVRRRRARPGISQLRGLPHRRPLPERRGSLALSRPWRAARSISRRTSSCPAICSATTAAGTPRA